MRVAPLSLQYEHDTAAFSHRDANGVTDTDRDPDSDSYARTVSQPDSDEQSESCGHGLGIPR